MIFYIALDDEGRRQIRGTQADARAVNRAFEQIDIPTDKPGLMAFVQRLYSRIDELSDQIVEGGEGLPDTYRSPDDVELEPAVADQFARDRQRDDIAPDDNVDFDPRVLEAQVEALGTIGERGLELLDTFQSLQGVGAAFSRGVHMLSVLAAGEHQLARVFLRNRRKK